MGCRDRLQRSKRKPVGVMTMIIKLTAIIASEVLTKPACTYVRT